MVAYRVHIDLTQCPRRLFNFYLATACNATPGLATEIMSVCPSVHLSICLSVRPYVKRV